MLEMVFRTDDLPTTDRFDCWYQLIRNSILPAIVRPDDVRAFRATTRLLDLTAVQVYTMCQTSLRVSRPARLVRQSDPEQCHLVLITGGSMVFTQAGRQTPLGAGNLMFYDSSRTFEGSVINDGDHAAGTQIQVQFPRAMLSRPALIDELIGCRLSGGGLGTLISGYLRELVKPAAGYRTGDAAGLATATMDLVDALVAHESHTEDWRPPELRDRALLNRILEFMRQRLGDPGLSPAMIAGAHHISVRYLHKLFQRQDLTVAAWIRRQRLERCHRDLGDPRHLRRPIHAVATRWGFTDNAHFSRLFRSAYGLSPSEYRHLAATGGSACIVNSGAPAVNDFPAQL
jgi:AraC-like DNA-binding protein